MRATHNYLFKIIIKHTKKYYKNLFNYKIDNNFNQRYF